MQEASEPRIEQTLRAPREEERKRWRRPSLKLIALFIFLISLTLLYSQRNALLTTLINRYMASYQTRHPELEWTPFKARFLSLGAILLQELQLTAKGSGHSLKIAKAEIHFKPSEVLSGRVQPTRIDLSGIHITVSPPPRAQTLIRSSPADRPSPTPPAYSERVDKLLSRFFGHWPKRIALRDLTIDTGFGSPPLRYRIPTLTLNSPSIDSPLTIDDGKQQWHLRVKGRIDPLASELALSLSSQEESSPFSLPLIDRLYGVGCTMRKARFELKDQGIENGLLSLSGLLALNGLTFTHPRIAMDPVEVDKVALYYFLTLGSDFVELAQPTRALFNRLRFNPSLRLVFDGPGQLRLKIEPTLLLAEDLFASLPKGLFTRLSGIQVKGDLRYHLDFSIDLAQPETLTLDTELQKDAFAIERFGAVDFREIIAPFEYTVYEKEELVKTIWIGPENPNFLPLDAISPYLRDSVLICEDGGFFRHRGFLLEPFKDSIATNIREGRFVRGGSTITMQLVKNLYLSRHKTIVRKLEEMLITWLIENNQLITKERMLEIYLNIIEWGPGIYGAEEAARFYFNKSATRLNLSESIFMASIIPRPKRFMVAFDPQQRLKEWMLPFYQDVSSKMLQREMITQGDYDSLNPDIRLTGPARRLLKGSPGDDDLFSIDEREE